MTRALIMTSMLLILAGFISTRDNQRVMGQDATPQSTQNPKVTLPAPATGVQPTAAALQSQARHVTSRLKTLANALGIDTAAHVQEASALTQISE
jgi:hypothetical protein